MIVFGQIGNGVKSFVIRSPGGGNNLTVDYLQFNMATLILGDINRDGIVDLLDVKPFVNLLVAGAFEPEGDFNQDCFVDLLDVQLFVATLTGG